MSWVYLKSELKLKSGINPFYYYCSRKAVKRAKNDNLNNEKNLGVFAPLREAKSFSSF
jgi:hypothetical protein